jgi:predicted O-methyltransferase YrrM
MSEKPQAVPAPGGVLRLSCGGKTVFRWNWKRGLLAKVLPVPFTARHAEYSLIASTDDEPGPSARLLDVAMRAVQEARTIALPELERRIAPEHRHVMLHWPGGHYPLLAALARVVQAKQIVEIGTAEGYSALALKHGASPEGRVATFDLIGWREHPASCLTEPDFADGRLVQYTDNLADPDAIRRHDALLSRADLIFLDAAKDGVTEPKLLEHLREIRFERPPLLVLDDIRVWNMLRVWRSIRDPKLDLTSFGHWTGTGLVEWLSCEKSCSGFSPPSISSPAP